MQLLKFFEMYIPYAGEGLSNYHLQIDGLFLLIIINSRSIILKAHTAKRVAITKLPNQIPADELY